MNKQILHGLASVFFTALTMGACAPTTVTGLAVDAAYTVSEERTTVEVVDDNKIKLALIRGFFDADIDLFKNVSTVVYRGRVLLLGGVGTSEAKARAGGIAARLEGVSEIINDIQVTDEGGVGGFVNDVLIEKKIQSSYLFDKKIKSANFRVRSVNGVVYLIGLAGSRAELDRALAKAHETSDVRKIVSYVHIKPPSS